MKLFGLLDIDYIRDADICHPLEKLPSVHSAAYHAWFKALFDSNSEGIEDAILRYTWLHVNAPHPRVSDCTLQINQTQNVDVHCRHASNKCSRGTIPRKHGRGHLEQWRVIFLESFTELDACWSGQGINI